MKGSYVYRVQYALPGGPSHTTVFHSEMPLELGQWITVDNRYLVIERVVPAKRGDPYDGIALCKLAYG